MGFLGGMMAGGGGGGGAPAAAAPSFDVRQELLRLYQGGGGGQNPMMGALSGGLMHAIGGRGALVGMRAAAMQNAQADQNRLRALMTLAQLDEQDRRARERQEERGFRAGERQKDRDFTLERDEAGFGRRKELMGYGSELQRAERDAERRYRTSEREATQLERREILGAQFRVEEARADRARKQQLADAEKEHARLLERMEFDRDTKLQLQKNAAKYAGKDAAEPTYEQLFKDNRTALLRSQRGQMMEPGQLIEATRQMTDQQMRIFQLRKGKPVQGGAQVGQPGQWAGNIAPGAGPPGSPKNREQVMFRLHDMMQEARKNPTFQYSPKALVGQFVNEVGPMNLPLEINTAQTLLPAYQAWEQIKDWDYGYIGGEVFNQPRAFQGTGVAVDAQVANSPLGGIVPAGFFTQFQMWKESILNPNAETAQMVGDKVTPSFRSFFEKYSEQHGTQKSRYYGAEFGRGMPVGVTSGPEPLRGFLSPNQEPETAQQALLSVLAKKDDPVREQMLQDLRSIVEQVGSEAEWARKHGQPGPDPAEEIQIRQNLGLPIGRANAGASMQGFLDRLPLESRLASLDRLG